MCDKYASSVSAWLVHHTHNTLSITALIPMLAGLMLAAPSDAARHIEVHRVTRLGQEFAQTLDQNLTHASANRSATPLRQSGRQTVMQVTLPTQTGTQTLLLEDNQGMLPPSTNTKGVRMLQGKLQGNSRSWARITRTSDGVHGLVWDGADLQVIEPSSALSSGTIARADADTVMFKLSDTTVDLGSEYCGSDPVLSPTLTANASSPSGLATYQALADEISADFAETGLPNVRLEMQIVADAEFRARYVSDDAAREALLVRLNNIDGIFSAQVGLEVTATGLQIYNSNPAALSNSTDAGALLSSLGQWRNSSALMSSYAVTHLFTGRDLDGDTLGIAYIGNVCSSRYGVSLSESRDRGAWIDSLVAAHELGHQLGAVHDGTGACSSTPAQGFLMDANINGSSTFSDCSKNTLLATMQYAACLVPVGDPDLIIPGSTPLQAITGSTLSWALVVQNIGTGSATSTHVRVTLPTGVTGTSATVPGGSCLTGTSNIECWFSGVDTYGSQQIDIELATPVAGTYALNATVDVNNDADVTNNATQFALTVQDNPDASPTTGNAAASTSSGGGGSFGLWLLFGLWWLQRRRSLQH